MYGFSSGFSPNLHSLYWKTTAWHSISEMIAFYATTFDALTMVISVYSYKKIKADAEPDKRIKTFWAVVFILFPIVLIFSEESMYRLQSVSIIAVFPIGIVIVLIIISFFKDAHRILHEK